MVHDQLKKHWLRTIIIVGMFVGAGLVPTIIETQLMPLAQISTVLTEFYDYNAEGQSQLNITKFLPNIKNIAYDDSESTDSKTVLTMTISFDNKIHYAYYDMLIPKLEVSLFYKAGRPYENEYQILSDFKTDTNFGDFPAPTYDYYAWVKVLTIEISQEYRIKPGQSQDVQIKLTLLSNGESKSALSQFLGSLIRSDMPDNSMHLKGNVYMMGVLPIPIDLGIPSMTSSDEGLGGITSMLMDVVNALFVTGPSGSFFHLADLQNYKDLNGNHYRDWNDTYWAGNPQYGSYAGNGVKDKGEPWTEPLLQNGVFTADIFLKLRENLHIDNLQINIPASDWDIEVEQNWTDSHYQIPFNQSAYSLWGTEKQQIILYMPSEGATLYGNENWSNRVIGSIGFLYNQTMDMDRTYITQPGGGKENFLPIDLGASIKISGDARPNANFGPGDAINVFTPLIPSLLSGENNTLILGIAGNLELTLGKMPLSITMNVEINETMEMNDEEASSTEDSGALSLVPDIATMIGNMLNLTNFAFNGLALDVFNKVLQTNETVGLDLFFPYGLYLPETEAEAQNFFQLTGGPIQMFNESLPTDFDNWTEVQKNQWYSDHLLFNMSIESDTIQDSIVKVLTQIGSYDNGWGIA
ncbi:MAG: hypothetical protein ACTSVY_14710, partial [Candidatus Helarchaeota archaeon]